MSKNLVILVASLFLCFGCGDEEASDGGADTGTNASTDTAADTGTDTAADSGSERLAANGCTYDEATDMTGAAEVDISAIAAWQAPHQVCAIVSASTTVSWDGNFLSHPMAGGVSPTTDATSPITLAGPGSGTDTLSVALAEAGDFPYFCGIHTGTMTGVIYVD
jgi:plastocyanin